MTDQTEMSVTKVYNVNNWEEESCGGLVSLVTLVGTVIVSEDFKVIAAVYCSLLKEVLEQ